MNKYYELEKSFSEWLKKRIDNDIQFGEGCEVCGLLCTGPVSNPSGYTRTYPSDCHDEGGHYQDHYDSSGSFSWSDAPWQTFPGGDLTQDEMREAQHRTKYLTSRLVSLRESYPYPVREEE